MQGCCLHLHIATVLVHESATSDGDDIGLARLPVSVWWFCNRQIDGAFWMKSVVGFRLPVDDRFWVTVDDVQIG